RPEKPHRPRALSGAAAGAAALPPPHDRAWLRRSDQDDLLGADCAGVPRRGLSDFAEHLTCRQRAGAAGDLSHPRLLAVHAARFRHLALFRRDQADHRSRLRLQSDYLGGGGVTVQARRLRGSARLIPMPMPARSRSLRTSEEARVLVAVAAVAGDHLLAALLERLERAVPGHAAALLHTAPGTVLGVCRGCAGYEQERGGGKGSEDCDAHDGVSWLDNPGRMISVRVEKAIAFNTS